MVRKILSVIAIILTFFIIYFAQINFFSWFNIAGIKPNLFVVLILFVGLFMNKKLAAVCGFILGLYLDVLTNKQVGISAALFAFIGYIAGFLDKTFSKESKITIILMVLGSTFAYETVLYVYTSIFNKIPLDILGFMRILLIELLFNCLLTIILYPMIRNLGIISERIFKESKINTGYLLNR